jgi:hypothetical protein
MSTEVLAGPCTAPYTTDKLLDDLIATEDFLRSYDFVSAGGAAQVLHDGIRCLNERMPSQVAGRTYRAIGGGLSMGGDSSEGYNWLVTAASLEPSFEYGLEDLAMDHPLRPIYSDASTQASNTKETVEGFGYFIAGTHYVDGRELTEPKASLGHPHLYQALEGSQITGHLINGNRFPSEYLSEKPPGDESAVSSAAVKAPKEKSGGPNVGLLAVGGVGVVASALTFVMSRGSKKKFDEGTTLADIEKYQSSTNSLSVVSGIALGVGLSGVTLSFVVDGGAPVPTVGFRF